MLGSTESIVRGWSPESPGQVAHPPRAPAQPARSL